jgi:hypothetical protein
LTEGFATVAGALDFSGGGFATAVVISGQAAENSRDRAQKLCHLF